MKRLEKLPLWAVIFVTVVFVLMWVYMSYYTFVQTAAGIAFWIFMTMTFLVPVLVVWLFYLEIL